MNKKTAKKGKSKFSKTMEKMIPDRVKESIILHSSKSNNMYWTPPHIEIELGVWSGFKFTAEGEAEPTRFISGVKVEPSGDWSEFGINVDRLTKSIEKTILEELKKTSKGTKNGKKKS